MARTGENVSRGKQADGRYTTCELHRAAIACCCSWRCGVVCKGKPADGRLFAAHVICKWHPSWHVLLS
jgi:hypothetical protein